MRRPIVQWLRLVTCAYLVVLTLILSNCTYTNNAVVFVNSDAGEDVAYRFNPVFEVYFGRDLEEPTMPPGLRKA